MGPSRLCLRLRQSAVWGSGWSQGCKKKACFPSQIAGGLATVAPTCALGNGPADLARLGQEGSRHPGPVEAGGVQTKLQAAEPGGRLLPLWYCHQGIAECWYLRDLRDEEACLPKVGQQTFPLNNTASTKIR